MRREDPGPRREERDAMVGTNGRFTPQDARHIGAALGIDWRVIDFEEFRMGLEVELEHGRQDTQTDVTHDDPLTTGKIALAHLKEISDYYTRLAKMEAEAQAERVAQV
jgi:hypothetical protein